MLDQKVIDAQKIAADYKANNLQTIEKPKWNSEKRMWVFEKIQIDPNAKKFYEEIKKGENKNKLVNSQKQNQKIEKSKTRKTRIYKPRKSSLELKEKIHKLKKKGLTKTEIGRALNKSITNITYYFNELPIYSDKQKPRKYNDPTNNKSESIFRAYRNGDDFYEICRLHKIPPYDALYRLNRKLILKGFPPLVITEEMRNKNKEYRKQLTRRYKIYQDYTAGMSLDDLSQKYTMIKSGIKREIKFHTNQYKKKTA